MKHLQSAIRALIDPTISALGLNAALCWQLDPGFVRATDPADFAARDNHARFVEGVWLSKTQQAG